MKFGLPKLDVIHKLAQIIAALAAAVQVVLALTRR